MPLDFGQLCRGVRRGSSPGDGVFVPVSPVYLLTRPNRMTVSLGTRAGTTTNNPAAGDSATGFGIFYSPDI